MSIYYSVILVDLENHIYVGMKPMLKNINEE